MKKCKKIVKNVKDVKKYGEVSKSTSVHVDKSESIQVDTSESIQVYKITIVKV